MKSIFASLSILVLLLASGCVERERVFRTDPTDAAGFTDRGWTSFTAGDLTAAHADFVAALVEDPTYAEAHLGQGWTLLGLALSTSAMTVAGSSFDSAVSNGLDNADLRAGRAAALLGSGESAAAIADAVSARTTAPNFVFSHRSSFGLADLFLIESFAAAAEGDLEGALAAADRISDSGIDAQNSSSWVVDGTGYSSFEGATLAFLHKMSEEHAG